MSILCWFLCVSIIPCDIECDSLVGRSVLDLLMRLQYLQCELAEVHISYIIRATLLALKYLHDSNVIHRDVKVFSTI